LEAEEAVEQDIRAYRVALKLYNGLSADAYHWLVSSARTHSLAVVGHVPDAVGLRGVIEARQDSIEHLDGFLEALQPDEASTANATTRQLLERADTGKLDALAESLRAAGIWNCPTLVLVKRVPEDAERQRRLGLLPPALVDRYRRGMPGWNAHPEVTQRLYNTYLTIVSVLHAHGARLLAGTDAPKPTVLPGFSLSDELQSFVQAGLTPYQALRAATSDAAIFLHQESEFGTVGPGLRADLILLKANPLQNIDNINERIGVMVAGRWYAEAELERRLLALHDSYRP
jgi:imidazolonepropionase-like amidohydrolase